MELRMTRSKAARGSGVKRKARPGTTKWIQVLILAGMGSVVSHSFANEEGDVSDGLLQAVEKADAATLFIRYLGTARGDAVAERELFAACISQMEESGNKEDLEVIGELLNSDRYLSGADSPTRRLIAELRPRASEAWYEIRQKLSSDQEEVETALYGVHPSPLVHVDVDVSLQRLRAVKDEGRTAYIAMLMNPHLEYRRSLWVTLASSAATSLIVPGPFDASEDGWILTEVEQDAILQNGGSYGRAVVIQALLRAEDARGIQVLNAWIQEHGDRPWTVNSVLQHVRSLDGADASTKHRFAESLIGFAQQAMDEIDNDRHGLPDAEWAASLYLVNQQLASLSSLESVREYFKEYRRFREVSKMSFLGEATEQYRNSVENSFDYADRVAGEVD